MPVTYYTVTGKWPFPKELMNQDRALPVSLADRNNIIMIEDKEISEENKEKRFTIALMSRRPRKFLEEDADYWESRGWSSSLRAFQHHRPEPLPLPSHSAYGKDAIKDSLPTDIDGVAASLIDLSLRYIDACAFLGHMATLMTNEMDRAVAKKIIEKCAESFHGAIEFTEHDDGGWSSRWCNTKQPK